MYLFPQRSWYTKRSGKEVLFTSSKASQIGLVVVGFVPDREVDLYEGAIAKEGIVGC